MKSCKAIQTVHFGPGDLLGLTPEQAAVRKGRIEVVNDKAGLFRVTGEVQFKAGEKLRLNAVPKRLANSLAELSAPAEKAARA